jgi:outer membrane protein OmpA-like peptidoglycan-associated protein
MKKTTVFFLAGVLILSGCAAPETKTGKGAAIGAGAGAVTGAIAGQAIGRNTKSTVLGAAIGAAAGAAIGAGVGHMMDQQEQEMKQVLAESQAASDAASVRREGELLAVTLRGDVTFDTNSARIKPGLYSALDRIADVMVRYPETRIIVEGHTDSKGKDDYNLELSRKRAQAVRDYLVRQGVGPERMEVLAFGKTQPIASNDTEEGRERNRRVEIKIQPTSAQ